MTIELQVLCINKTDRENPHERIRNIGGVNPNGSRWKFSQHEAITRIESGGYAFYTNVNGKKARVIVATHLGNKYLKTENDGVHPNNLLALPECPA